MKALEGATVAPAEVSRHEAATLLGVHYNTIRDWETRGLLRSRRVQRGKIEEVRILLEDVEQLQSQGYTPEDSPDEVAVLRGQNELLRAQLDELQNALAIERARLEKLIDALVERARE